MSNHFPLEQIAGCRTTQKVSPLPVPRQGYTQTSARRRLQTQPDPRFGQLHVHPPEIEERLIPSYRAGDFIKGKDNASAIGTLAELASDYVIIVD